MGGTTTVTDERFRKAHRQFTSPRLTGKDAIDKLSLTFKLVHVLKIYPLKHQAEVRLRDEPESESFKVDMLMSMADINSEVSWVVDGDIERETDGYYSIAPDDELLGGMLAIEGDLSGNGGILIGYLDYNPTEQEEEPPMFGYTIKHGESVLRITETSISMSAEYISIDSPNLSVNGNPLE